MKLLDFFFYAFVFMWFFNGLDFAFNIVTDKKDNGVTISVDSKPTEKKKEDKDTIKTDW